jgi:hypothetical protein
MAVAIPLALSIIPILIALYAVRVSLRAEKYAGTQVELMQEQERKREREQAILDDWAAKLDKAISAIQRLGPHWLTSGSAVLSKPVRGHGPRLGRWPAQKSIAPQ